MFCVNCGTKLADDAAFCTNCGNPVSGGKPEVKVKEKVVDNNVMLNVKPTFKLIYMLLPYIPTFLIFIAPVAFMLSMPSDFAGVADQIKTICTYIIIGILAITAISIFFVKKQYKAYNYDFYKTKVVYRDSFINISEKEVKYKHIREVYLRRGLVQRMFGLGTIVLYTNAETGYLGGITINNVENAEEVYKNIKELIDVED